MVGTGLANDSAKHPGSRITFVPGEGLANVKTIIKGRAILVLCTAPWLLPLPRKSLLMLFMIT